MSQFKQILENGYWDEKENLLIHECNETRKGYTIQIDSKMVCNSCKKEAPQEIVDICLLVNIKPWYIYKTIKGRWGIEKDNFNSKSYLTHLCKRGAWPGICNSTHCRLCNTKMPEHIIKYCEENALNLRAPPVS